MSSRRQVPELEWARSRYSDPGEACIEIAAVPNGFMLIRNSRDPDGFWLLNEKPEMRDFIAGAKAGDFDHLVADSPT